MSAGSTVPAWKRWGAGLLGLSAAAIFFVEVPGPARWQVGTILASLTAGAAVVHVPRMGPQLLARAAWWSTLVVGLLLCVFGGQSERHWGFLVALLCGGALLVAGRKGLAEASERDAHAPAAFAGTLLLMMVFALADAQTLVLLGILSFDNSGTPDAILLFAGAAALACGFVGLYRLALWGALVNVATSGVLLAMCVTRRIEWADSRKAVTVLSLVQLVCAAPMLLSLALRRPLRPRTRAKVRRLLSTGTIIAAVAAGGILAYDLVDVRWR
jgi:hypothetical protein